jgi:hypothetical protein
MTQDIKNPPDSETTTQDAKPEDPSASELFFGGHLEDLVKGTAKPVAPEIATAPDAEKTVETPSMLFFGEHLEQAVSTAEPAAGADPTDDER